MLQAQVQGYGGITTVVDAYESYTYDMTVMTEENGNHPNSIGQEYLARKMGQGFPDYTGKGGQP